MPKKPTSGSRTDRDGVADDSSSLRRGSSTASFGTSSRENHDSSAFYARFVPPETSDDETVVPIGERPASDETRLGTAEDLLLDERFVKDNSVALVVTSPPYFVGKTYEEAMGKGHVPVEYEEHLANLHRVFELCVRKLEPGGRIAVNVANLGRKPYRSQSADIIRIFEDLKLLLRGEVIWRKGDGMNSSTAWGSFQRPSSPVLRDITERVIIASKGRFERALTPRKRAEAGLPSEGSIFRDEFMSAVKDVWEIPAESATRVGHPAPFPVGLPKRLIDLYTYRDDLILDPYMGSGTTGIAAVRKGRNFVGCEAEPEYVQLSADRVAAERDRLVQFESERERIKVRVPAIKSKDAEIDAEADPAGFQASVVQQGKLAEDIAQAVLEACGFSVRQKNKKLKTGPEIDFVATAADGSLWHFDVTGAFTSERDGLRRTDTVWKSLGKAAARQADGESTSELGLVRYVLLTTSLPDTGVGRKALQACMTPSGEGPIFDAVEMLTDDGQQRLRSYAVAGNDVDPPDGLATAAPDQLF